jgi:hypothetical protein
MAEDTGAMFDGWLHVIPLGSRTVALRQTCQNEILQLEYEVRP